MAIWSLALAKSQILLCPTFSGYRFLCQLHTEAWGEKGVTACNSRLFSICGEHPFPPGKHVVIISLPRWHFPWTIRVHMVLISWLITRSFAGKKSLSGTDVWLTTYSSNPHLLSHRREQGFWHRIVVTGSLHCPSLTDVCCLGLVCVSHTTVTVGL